MNWGAFKDPLCYLCLAGLMVTPWSLTQNVAGSNNPFNYILSLNSAKTFRENSILVENLRQVERPK